MKIHASIKYLKISSRKLRLSADLVRGLPVAQAEQVLAATPKKGSVMVAEALKSAVANAENNQNARKSSLRIAEIKVDEGPTLKRFRPRSRGMAAPILHRMSHLTVVVTDEAAPEKKRSNKKVEKTPKKQLAASGKEA
jgi:large subunit ribosomal protein L22